MLTKKDYINISGLSKKKYFYFLCCLVLILSITIFGFKKIKDIRTKNEEFIPVTGVLPIDIFSQKPEQSEKNLPESQNQSTDQLIFLPFVCKDGQAYFVSTTGNDSNPGTIDKPWKTIGKAARMVSPGITIYIRGGTYSEVVEVRNSGTENKPIQFIAYPGEFPVIDGYNQVPTYWVGLFSMLGDWIRVSGIEIRNSKYDGVGLYGNHNIADNIYAHHNQYHGALIKSDFGTVQNSRFWRNSLMNEFGKSGNGSSALYAAHDFENGLADYSVIKNNLVWENWGEGVSTSNSNNIQILNNVTHDNYSANIYISDATNIIVEGNFSYMNPNSIVYGYGSNVGIMLGDEQYDPPSANISIINNIAFGNNRNFYWWRGVKGGGMNNVLIANNTFVNSVATSGVIIMQGSHQNVRLNNNITLQEGLLPVIIVEYNEELSFSNNLWSKIPPYAASSPSDVIGDPKLSKNNSPFTQDWYLLTSVSPAIDKGKTLIEIIIDYYGNIRDNVPDIGAHELISLQ